MYDQIALFDETPVCKTRLPSTLDEYALLYTCTAKGNNSDIHFMMTREDAVKWCESDLSKGVMMGTPWAYFWTSVKNFVFCPWGGNIDLRKARDNGKWDDKIASLGLKKISIDEMPSILQSLGVTVIR